MITAFHDPQMDADRLGLGVKTAASGGGTFSVATDDDILYVGSNKAASSPVYRLHESFVEFSLSNVPTDATVVSATITGMLKASVGSAAAGYVRVFTFNWGAALASSDWRAPVHLAALPVAALVQTAGQPLGTRLTFANADLVAQLQAALAARLWRAVLADALMYEGFAPTVASYVGFYSEEGDTEPDPLVGQVVSTLVSAVGSDPGFEPDAARVAVLDLSQHLLSTADAQAEGARYLALLGSAAYHGRITVKAPTIGLHGGGTKLAAYVRAGETVKEQNAGVVLWIRAADYDADSSTLTLDVGVDPTEYRYLPPGQRNELGG